MSAPWRGTMPTLGIRWPLPAGVAPALSAKDARGKSFAEIEKFP